ncbi:DUF6115 domain-containing protein [Cohnella laeviribosi]|uniref:DUF6115 domain-containing protein n=1 Tax=Cohnella laeviribosi TaxID=380174 RepID=UPI000369217C|nr:hypothetical protein [Cohnella laeviribosi]
MMEPWVSIVLTGAAIAGFGWLIPKADRKEDSPGFQTEEAYDRLLTDLEAENRELVEAVEKFKREQDLTVERLNRRIREMERQMAELLERPAAAARSEAAAGIRTEAAGPNPQVPSALSAPSAPPEQREELAEEADAAPATIRERYAELLSLDKKGRSIEQIAKAMNMNKGEVQLILQLAKREAERLA